jgi:two-component system alkaline phosphatase synthesis response regulator PhoP
MNKLNKKILIVEDEETMSRSLTDVLVMEGFDVEVATDGEEGIEKTLKGNPDLILLDIVMPKMDGITMAKKLKEQGVNIPIIVLTNLNDLESISKAVEVGSFEYLIKTQWKIADVIDKIKQKLGI